MGLGGCLPPPGCGLQHHDIWDTGSRRTQRQTQALATFSLSWEGNTTHSGRRVLRSGGPNHSKSLVFIVFLSEIELGLANPRVNTLWARAGAFRHPAVVCNTTTHGITHRLIRRTDLKNVGSTDEQSQQQKRNTLRLDRRYGLNNIGSTGD